MIRGHVRRGRMAQAATPTSDEQMMFRSPELSLEPMLLIEWLRGGLTGTERRSLGLSELRLQDLGKLLHQMRQSAEKFHSHKGRFFVWQRLLKQMSKSIAVVSYAGQFRQRRGDWVTLLTCLVARQAEVATARRRPMAGVALKNFQRSGRCGYARRVAVDCVVEPKPARIPGGQSPERRVIAVEARDVGQLRRL